MTTLTYPALSATAPRELKWTLQSNTQTFTSPLNGATQTIELPGARWMASMSYPPLFRDDSGILRSTLAKLRGQANRILVPHFGQRSPRGLGTGSPLVNGGGQAGTTLNTSGWTPSITGILKEGDFFNVGGELKMCVADANSNGSGQATITFEPPLRTSPGNASAIIVSMPTCLMMLADNRSEWLQQFARSGSDSNAFSFELSFIEAFS